MKIRTATTFLVFLCSGCLPYPHFEVKVSDVKGKVTRDGIPLSGATVRISEKADWECNEALFATSTTNSEGQFDLKGKKKFRLVRPLIGDPFYINQLCIITGEETFLGYLGGGVGWPPETLHVTCNITSGSVKVTAKTPLSEIHRYAVCRIITKKGNMIAVFWNETGTMYGTSEAAGARGRVSGTWKITDDGQLCSSWNSSKWESGCRNLFLDEKTGQIQNYNREGTPTGTITEILPGNPENLN